MLTSSHIALLCATPTTGLSIAPNTPAAEICLAPNPDQPGTVLGLRVLHGNKIRKTYLLHLWDDQNAQIAHPDTPQIIKLIFKTLGGSTLWHHHADEAWERFNTLIKAHHFSPTDKPLNSLTDLLETQSLSDLALQLNVLQCDREKMSKSSITQLGVLEHCWTRYFRVKLENNCLMDNSPQSTFQSILTKHQRTHMSLLQNQSGVLEPVQTALALLAARGLSPTQLARLHDHHSLDCL
jgi:hypothetical protein